MSKKIKTSGQKHREMMMQLKEWASPTSSKEKERIARKGIGSNITPKKKIKYDKFNWNYIVNCI